MTDIAKNIIALRDREQQKQAVWHSIWQDAADLCYPAQDQINSQGTPGEDQSLKRHDDSGVLASQKMASGMLVALMPIGKKFFGITLRNRELADLDPVRRWIMRAVEDMHYELFASNFRQQFDGAIRSGIVFGTGCLFSEFNVKTMPMRLNFRDHAINLYQIKEDFAGSVDTVILSYRMTARQIMQEWPGGNLSPEIVKAAEKLETESDKFDIIRYVSPRKDRKTGRTDSKSMPWSSYIVDVKAPGIIEEGGFTMMPFHVFRWSKRANEKYGRGPGTDCLARLRMLQKMEYDRIDLANRYAHPPYLKSESFEGNLDVRPNAVNVVQDIDKAVRGIEMSVLGNFPITQNEVDAQRKLIREAFYQDVFSPITDLPGDRRTTVEIQARIQEGLRQLGSPVGRLESELLSPLLERTLDLLITHGRIPPPPAELSGQVWNFEYTGQLALALRDQEAKGFMQFAAFAGEVAAIYPPALDTINFEKAMPDMAESMGVNADHMATEEEIAAKREARAAQQAAQEAMQAAEVAGKAYKSATAAPEAGSPAEQLVKAGA